MRPEASSVSFRVSAKSENLAAIRRSVKAATEAVGIDPATVTEVVLAADEAISNIIFHGYQGQPGIIEIEVKRESDALLICLRDEAPPFDPTTVPAPDMTMPLEERAAGGLGLHLIRQIMDEVTHHTPCHGGNELVLVKRVEGGEQ